MKLNWSGNLILEINGKEESFRLESIDVEKNTSSGYEIKICGKDSSARVVIPLSRQDAKKLIMELTQRL